MESQPQNPELRNNSENFHPCIMLVVIEAATIFVEYQNMT